MWRLGLMRGDVERRFDWCRFDRPYLKPTVLLTNADWLDVIELRCVCLGGHIHLEGQRTTDAAAYSAKFGQAVAEAAQPHAPELSSWAKQEDKRSFKSHAWTAQLSEALDWRTIMQYDFRGEGHINLLEARARGSLWKRLPRDLHVPLLQDSFVSIGSGSKGRSPSAALNYILCVELPWLLGKNLQPGVCHAWTWNIRADAPSRHAAPDGPRSVWPIWMRQLHFGQVFEAEAALDTLSNQPRAVARWALMGGAILLRLRTGPVSAPAEEWPEGLCRHRSRTSVRDNSRAQGEAPCRIQDLCGGEHGVEHRGALALGCPFASVLPRGVWQASLRGAQAVTRLCRNSERCPADLPLDAWVALSRLEGAAHVGRPGADGGTPTDAGKCAPGDGMHRALLGVAEGGDVATHRLLLFTEANRTLLLAASGFDFAGDTWDDEGHIRQNRRSEDQAQRSSKTACKDRQRVRRGVLDALVAKVPEFREDLGLLAGDFSQAIYGIESSSGHGAQPHASIIASARRSHRLISRGRRECGDCGVERQMAKPLDVGEICAGAPCSLDRISDAAGDKEASATPGRLLPGRHGRLCASKASGLAEARGCAR
jgi:hypothetical protein